MQLFFSRRIGLSENGEPIPDPRRHHGLQDAREAYSVGVLNIQQREGQTTAAANFTALRLRRDVLANSDIGAILLNKEDNGPHFNRVAGLDANFRFGDPHRERICRQVVLSRPGSSQIWRAPTAMRMRAGPASTIRAGRGRPRRATAGLGERFNDEVGFVPRRGIDNFDGRFGRQIRPPARYRNGCGRCNRIYELDLFLRQADGTLETSYQGYHWNFNFQDGSNAEFGVNRMIEDIPEAFTINNSTGTQS